MGKRRAAGNSFSMNKEVNIAGSEVTICSTKSEVYPNLTTPNRDQSKDFAAMLPGLMGALPAAGVSENAQYLVVSALGAVCAAGNIKIEPDPTKSDYLLTYAAVLNRVMNYAHGIQGTLSEDELRKLILEMINNMLEKAGPAYSSWKQVLMESMQNDSLANFMKGVQEAVCAMVGDPVNANTGNFIYEKEDLLIKGYISLVFRRSYNRIDARTGCMGKGWRHNYEIQLLIEKDRYIIVWGDGREEPYLRNKDDSPEPLFGDYCRLRLHREGFIFETQEKESYIFDSGGKLLKQENLNGKGLQFLYDKHGRLSSVRSSYGAALSYGYDTNTGMLNQVADQAGRKVTLVYDLCRLKQVINADGGSYQYTYNSDNTIYQIYNPRGICVLKNNYDTHGRVIKQIFADGGEMRYEYQEDLSRTLVTDQNGNKVAYVHDDHFRNIKTIYMDGEETFSYNNRNQLSAKTDKNGNRTKFSYDDKNNTTQILYPDGAKYNMTYDACNRLLTLSINGIIKIKNTYDEKGNLIKSFNALGYCRMTVYDVDGKPVELIQPDGSSTFIDYDNCGNIIKITDSAGNTTVYKYDDCNRVTFAIDGNGNSTSFSYDNANRITSVTNAFGRYRTYEYTKNGKLAKLTDFNGAVTSWKYNNMNQVKSITFPNGGCTSFDYDLMQNVSKRTLPNGAEIFYTYDSLNRLEQVILPTGGAIRYEYDPNGNRTAMTDPIGNRTTMEYDECDRVTKRTNPAGDITKYAYDMEGRLICITDAMGKQHSYIYDEAGQLVTQTDVLGNITCYEYNAMGKLSCIVDSKMRKSTYEYAPGGILSKSVYPDGKYETYTYDKAGNLICRRNQKGDSMEFAYDCMNRLIALESSFGQKKRYSYDAAGNVDSVTDSLGHITHYGYSPCGRLTSVLDAAGNRTEYAYDQMGNLVLVCQHEGRQFLLGMNEERAIISAAEGGAHITRYKRNLLGKIETIINPLGLKEHYSYDVAGRLTSKKDQDGYETEYKYNPVGDMETVTYGDGRSIAFAYNSLRQLIQIQDWLGTTVIEPDEMGRAKRIIDYKGREVSYQWGNMGEREAILYPNGHKISYEYDELSRLTRLTDGEREVYYTYNEDGRLSEKIFPEDMRSVYHYNSMGLLSELIHQNGDEILENYEYEYDLQGNKTAMRKKRLPGTDLEVVPREMERKMLEERGSYEYRYDSMNRLAEVRRNRERISLYEYDVFGNRTMKQEGERNTRYYYNAANQLIRTEGAYPEESFQYDGRGNMIAIRQGEAISSQYFYDASNRLTAATNAEGLMATYQYNGSGSQVGVQEYMGQMKIDEFGSPEFMKMLLCINPAKETDYLIDLTKRYHNLLLKTETDAEGSTTQRFSWDSNAVFMTEGENAHIYFQDDLGSTIRLVGKGENHQEVYGYDEFGQDLYGTQGNTQPFGYTGYQMDRIANTYFAQAREYMPRMGRFCGEDIIKGGIIAPTTLNVYAYCYSNPLKWIDLNGAWPIPTKGSISQSDKAMPSEATYNGDYWKYRSETPSIQHSSRVGNSIATKREDEGKVLSLVNDEQGIILLTHYLYGEGEDIVDQNGYWADYLKAHDGLKSEVQDILFPIGEGLAPGNRINIDNQYNKENGGIYVENGENKTGYNYLHGPEATVGAFQIKGSISKDDTGAVTYDLVYTWNDILDVNTAYTSDKFKSKIANVLSLGQAEAYNIKISWTDRAVIGGGKNCGWLFD